MCYTIQTTITSTYYQCNGEIWTWPFQNNVELSLYSVSQLRKSLKKPCNTLNHCLHVNFSQEDQTDILKCIIFTHATHRPLALDPDRKLVIVKLSMYFRKNNFHVLNNFANKDKSTYQSCIPWFDCRFNTVSPISVYPEI
jgi:hypothetical protein